MKKVGMYMALFGVLTIVLNFLDRVPTLLAWIYNWGDTTAWAIKIGLVVVGAILFFMGNKKEETSNSEEDSKLNNKISKENLVSINFTRFY